MSSAVKGIVPPKSTATAHGPAPAPSHTVSGSPSISSGAATHRFSPARAHAAPPASNPESFPLRAEPV